MNYGSMILDFVDELSAGTQKTADLCKLAGVKSISSADDISRLDDEDFALVILKKGEKFRKFPLNRKANTELSKESFLRNKSKLTMDAADIAESRIKMACVRYQLSTEGLSKRAGTSTSPFFLHTQVDDFDYLKREGMTNMAKNASMKKFAIDAMKQGHPIKKFPINTPDEVKTAAENISVKLPVQFFIKAAKNVLARADELNVTIDPLQEINIIKNASISPLFNSEIQKRMRLTGGVGATQFMDLQKTASDGDLCSVALALEALDDSTRIMSKWGSGILHPALAVFGFPKVAEMIEMDHGTVSEEELSSFVSDNKEEVSNAIGNAGTQGLIDTPLLSFRALPAPHRQYIAEMIGDRA